MPTETDFECVVRIIGRDAALKLCREFNGMAVYIPKEDWVLKAEHDEEILEKAQERRARGQSFEQIGRALGISRYSVSRRLRYADKKETRNDNSKNV